MKIEFDSVDTLIIFDIHKKCIDNKYDYISIKLKDTYTKGVVSFMTPKLSNPVILVNNEIEISKCFDTKVNVLDSVEKDDDEKEIYNTHIETIDLYHLTYPKIYICKANKLIDGIQRYRIEIK